MLNVLSCIPLILNICHSNYVEHVSFKFFWLHASGFRLNTLIECIQTVTNYSSNQHVYNKVYKHNDVDDI